MEIRTIEVPVVDQPPARDHPVRVVAISQFLLTALLRHDYGILRADRAVDGGAWRLRVAAGEDQVIATFERMFRPILARFAISYMGFDHVYGGYAEMNLVQNGRSHSVAMYMANDSWRGFWIKVYSRRIG